MNVDLIVLIYRRPRRTPAWRDLWLWAFAVVMAGSAAWAWGAW